MKKYMKWFGAFAVIGALIGLIIAVLKKNDKQLDDEFEFEEEEDFDLDNDLKPVSEREYVPLKKAAQEAPEADTEKETASEAAADKTVETTDKETEKNE